MKATVDKEPCISCGPCTAICPAVFVMNDDAKAGVSLAPVPPDKAVACSEAAAGCPAGAITPAAV